jgi:hypothetical protein
MIQSLLSLSAALNQDIHFLLQLVSSPGSYITLTFQYLMLLFILPPFQAPPSSFNDLQCSPGLGPRIFSPC